MAGLLQAVRNNFSYGSGYFQGRLAAFPSSLTELYGASVAKLTSFLSLPLPLLSFLALPLYGGSSTTINLVVFYLTWSTLVFSKGPLTIELYGTLAIRLFCFVLPALGFLAFDTASPNLSRKLKSRGRAFLPGKLGRDKVLFVAAVAVGNVLISILLQAVLEILFTRVLRLRSLLKVTTAVPLPWSIFTDLLKGFVVRGVAHYAVHRYALHQYDSVLKTWHLGWHHSIDFPFSLMATFDHPVNYLLGMWMPTILPAYIFRWHVLVWHLFLVLVSLQELFIYSGYSVSFLPSTIILPGMARRIEAHFDSVKEDQPGNFGHLGVIDFLVGTSCQDEDDVMDDMADEAEKHRVQDKVHKAVDSTSAAVEKKQKARKRK